MSSDVRFSPITPCNCCLALLRSCMVFTPAPAPPTIAPIPAPNAARGSTSFIVSTSTPSRWSARFWASCSWPSWRNSVPAPSAPDIAIAGSTFFPAALVSSSVVCSTVAFAAAFANIREVKALICFGAPATSSNANNPAPSKMLPKFLPP